MSSKTIAFATLGCKVNQYETAVFRKASADGALRIVPFQSEADVYVVNTCSVTGKADAESRRLIRQAYRRNPSAEIYVTGCYSTRSADEIRRLPGVVAVVPNKEKDTLIQRVTGTVADGRVRGGILEERARSFLKVQDGCDNFCSYCIVPHVRGPSRSVPPDVLCKAARDAEAQGFREIVLTGIHIGFYGRELEGSPDLVGLLKRLLKETRRTRFRISSLEITEVGENLLDLLVREDRICRHLHLPLQSGSRTILERMKRNYDPATYINAVARIRRAVNDICIGADVIAGFPGESDQDFQATLSVIEKAGIDYLHAFSFSPRPGTPAQTMENHVEKRIINSRVNTLRSLSSSNFRNYKDGQVGRVRHAIIQSVEPDGSRIGITDNYIHLRIDGSTALPRSLVAVKITSRDTGKPAQTIQNSV